jgi:uncharacterized NAD-dependent epimerase/dehydratase family protein
VTEALRSDGTAIVYCDGAYRTANGKTAHGLVRHTRRYQVLCVIDSTCAGADAGELLDGRPRAVPVVAGLVEALSLGKARGMAATHFVIGIAPDGGRMDGPMRQAILAAIEAGLHVDSGMHDFLEDDAAIVAAARARGVRLRDVRKTPSRRELHGFSGRIEEVTSTVIAVLGTDSAVGKRTTAWMLVDALRDSGCSAEMIRTGQTGWMQGARYGILLDSLINDFVAGELEHAVVSCWEDLRPDFQVIEGQGSLMNPAYPGGFEILAATRPAGVVLQHAPTRREYDGFPGHPLHPIETQIQAIELVSGRKVVALTVNQEGMTSEEEVERACRELEARTGRPTVAPLVHGLGRVVEIVRGLRA